MKHLVETNLESIGNRDFRDLYTDEVKKAMLDYAQGKHNSSPRAEQDYIFAKFRAAVEEFPDEITVLPKYDVDAYLSQGYRKIYVDCQCGTSDGTGEEASPVSTFERALELARTGERTAICIREGEYFVSDTVK